MSNAAATQNDKLERASLKVAQNLDAMKRILLEMRQDGWLWGALQADMAALGIDERVRRIVIDEAIDSAEQVEVDDE